MIAALHPGGSGAATAALQDGGVATPSIARPHSPCSGARRPAGARIPLTGNRVSPCAGQPANPIRTTEDAGGAGAWSPWKGPCLPVPRRPWARGVCAARCRLHSISSKRHDTSWQMGVALHQLALQGGPR